MAWGGAWELFAVFPQPLELKPGKENPVQRHQTAPWWKTQTTSEGLSTPGQLQPSTKEPPRVSVAGESPGINKW